MSIATAIQNAQTKVAAAYTAAANKGATMPVVQDLSSLADTIGAIPAGGDAPAHYVEKTVVDGVLKNSPPFISLAGVTDVGAYVLNGAYYGVSFPANTSVDLSSLTTISGDYACENMARRCTGLTSVDLSSLTTVSGVNACNYMFYNCTELTSVDLSSLTTISGGYACSRMFQSCASLTSMDLSSLTTISGASACYFMFYGCTRPTSVDLSSLTTISGDSACSYMFNRCTGLTNISFPSLREILPATTQNQFTYMFGNCTALTEIHFPSNMQSRIEQMEGYATKFGAKNATIYFDLPPTE